MKKNYQCNSPDFLLKLFIPFTGDIRRKTSRGIVYSIFWIACLQVCFIHSGSKAAYHTQLTHTHIYVMYIQLYKTTYIQIY